MEENTLIEFPNVHKVLDDFANTVLTQYKQGLVEKNKNASSELYNTARCEVNINGSECEAVLYLQDYWKYVEHGRRPGKRPPMDAILKWVQIKPVIPRPMANGKLPTERQLSFLISRIIGEKGIKPTPLLSDSVKSVYDDFYQRLEDAFETDLYNIVKKYVVSISTMY